MKILVHSETTERTLHSMLGKAEYSYYFVLREFRGLLAEFGEVVEVSDPEGEVDRLHAEAEARGELAVFCAFSPPHRTWVPARCPVVPFFAWEFDSIPDEAWHGDPRNDWRTTLARTAGAVTHSRFALDAVRTSMGADYPIESIPAPLWDRQAASRAAPRRALADPVEVAVSGLVVDSRGIDLAPFAPAAHRTAPPPHFERSDAPAILRLEGVVYGSVFTPYDGRKNWYDMVTGFCRALGDRPDATLVLKLTHYWLGPATAAILAELYKLQPFRCRVVVIDGFLSEADFARLIASFTYVVNTSHGEGQCLPLMEAMSIGRPAISPAHSAMAEYVHPGNAFVVASSPEATFWSHDPRQVTRTMRYRLDWSSLAAAYAESYRVATAEPERYRSLAAEAIRSLEGFCSWATARTRLARLFEGVAHRRPADPGREVPA